MAALLNGSERDKVDEALRLPGLKFPKYKRVIGNKYTALMMALGAIDAKRGRAGNQLAVVQRLALLYQTVLLINKENPALDIASDRFFSTAIFSISDKHPNVSKNLTPESLRLVIDLYTQAFARSGWKVIKKHATSPNEQQMVDSAQAHAPQTNGGGSDELMWTDHTVEESTDILQPIEPVGDRVNLERLVKEWMVVRGIARSGAAAEEKPVFNFKEIGFPLQKPDEPANAYMLRLQNEFHNLDRSKHAENYVLSYVSDQRRERLDEQHQEIEQQRELYNLSLGRLDEQHQEIEDQRRLFDLSLERIDQQSDEIDLYKKRADKAQERLDQQHDEIQECKKRVDKTRQRLDRQRDEITEYKRLAADHRALSYVADQRLERIEQQSQEIGVYKIYKALADQRRERLDNQSDKMEEYEKRIGAMQQIIEGMDLQDEVTDRLDEGTDGQDEGIGSAHEMMDGQHEVLPAQDLERHVHMLEGVGVGPFAPGEGQTQAGRFPESFERGGASDA